MSAAKNLAAQPKKPAPAPFNLKGSVGSLANRLTEAQPGEKILKLPVDKVCANPKQHRKYFDPELLQELANSIEEIGQIGAIGVRPNPDPKGPPYIIIWGERRWRACKLTKLGTVDAVLRQLTEDQAVEILLAEVEENANRVGLTLDEEINAWTDLVALVGLEKAALKAKRRKEVLSRAVQISKAPPVVQEVRKLGLANDINTLHRLTMLAKESEGEAIRLVEGWKLDPSKAVYLRDQIDAARDKITKPGNAEADRQNSGKVSAASGAGSGDSSASHIDAGGAGTPPDLAVRPGSSQGESAGRSVTGKNNVLSTTDRFTVELDDVVIHGAQRSERGDGSRSGGKVARAGSGASGAPALVVTSAEFGDSVIVLQTNDGPKRFDRASLTKVLGLDG